MGAWADRIAKGEPDVEALLSGVPGEMCPRIDEWVGKKHDWRSLTRLGRERDYEDVESLYADADALNDERNNAIDGLEECRTALDRLRGALVDAIAAYREQRDRVAELEALAERAS